MPPPELAQAVPVRNDAHRRRRRRLQHRHRHGRASPASSPPRRISDNLGQPRATSGNFGQPRAISGDLGQSRAISSGELAFKQRVPCGGVCPRSFVLDYASPGGPLLLVGNQVERDRPRSPEIEITRDRDDPRVLVSPGAPPASPPLRVWGTRTASTHTTTHLHLTRAGWALLVRCRSSNAAGLLSVDEEALCVRRR